MQIATPDTRPRPVIFIIKEELGKRLSERYGTVVRDYQKRGSMTKYAGNGLYYNITQVRKSETLVAFVEYNLVEYVDEQNSVSAGSFLADDLMHDFIYDYEINTIPDGAYNNKMVCRSGAKVETIDLNIYDSLSDCDIIERIYTRAESYYDD